MRRKDREVTDFSEIIEVVSKCREFRIGLCDNGRAYIVPLNFGYAAGDGSLTIYFHSAKAGRKVELIGECADVAFEMDITGGVKNSDSGVACSFGYLYQCVMGEGRAELLPRGEEKNAALAAIMRHQTGREFAFDDKMAESVNVYRIAATALTCKKSGM